VTACALGSLNQIAPGRLVCGIGTGNSARRAMRLAPYTLRELREHVNVVRGLLSGGDVEYREGDARRTIRFFHQSMQSVNLREPIPIYVAANQPRAMDLAGEIGDGFHHLTEQYGRGVERLLEARASQRGAPRPQPDRIVHDDSIDRVVDASG
jgi:alkanesulfonate monooxygenase SsuD/methylene tetrahydromethanopterin reductase-like flavin-dependent oxidoreductase (luciferase family)